MLIQKSYDQFALSPEATIQDALVAITNNHLGTVIVVDKDNAVLGVLSDGDIRRALVRDALLVTPIMKVLNTDFISVYETDPAAAEKIFAEYPGINVIPILNKRQEMIGVAIRK
jgi:CBS domain-containing protein